MFRSGCLISMMCSSDSCRLLCTVTKINQAYAGFSGGIFDPQGHDGFHQYGSIGYQYWYKPLAPGGAKTAVLTINTGDQDRNYTISFSAVPGVTCTTCNVRDVWARKDLGPMASKIALALPRHDSGLLVITPAGAGAVVEL